MARWRRIGASLASAVAVAYGVAVADADALELKGAGTTLQADLFAAWIQQFAAANPGIRLTYEPVGSNESIRLLSTGEVEFVASDKPIAGQQSKSDAKGVLEIPVTARMIVVVYNIPDLEEPIRLSRKALANIFNGTVAYWDDSVITAANPKLKLPHHEITIVAPTSASGATLAMNRYLSTIGGLAGGNRLSNDTQPAWTAEFMTASGDEGVARRIEMSEYALGYVGYPLAARLGLHSALLENLAGQFVRAGAETGSAALASAADASSDGRVAVIDDPPEPGAYPIVAYNWLLLRSSYDDPKVVDGLQLFVGWILSQGLQSLADNGFLPLPGVIAEQARTIAQRLR
jgi:phosphate transport system substrate-binding protein